ncbi:MAG: N-6 DNA Methylase [Euryarchaeota archaeon ADurb.Bin190]|jgi:type I restriction enzyme M protein|nr:MAG: N-6 DNA Methylase [Euryarchaeota archaeon ADurb.Bin190]
MNMLLHGLPDADIRKGDVIREPKLLIDGQLMLFDRVIANPPFSLDKWGYEVAESDGYGRFHYGVPPKTKGDFAFVEHMIATLNQEGKMGVVVPHGVLFRGGAEGRIREGICKEDIIEAVIGLPAQLFYGTGIPAAILVINKNKPRERRGSILFVDGSQDYLEGKKQNKLRPEDIEKIVGAYRSYQAMPKYCRVVQLFEIEENDYNLNISRYVDTAPEEEQIDVAEALRELKQLEARRREIESQMDGYLKELGYGN